MLCPNAEAHDTERELALDKSQTLINGSGPYELYHCPECGAYLYIPHVTEPEDGR